MQIESLRYFLEITRCGTFSLAARKLFISQQGLSKSVKALEHDLNVELFERQGKKVRLTAAGKALVPLAEAHIGTYEQLIGTMAALSTASLRQQPVPLFAMPYTAALLRQVGKGFAADASASPVTIIEEDLATIIAALQRAPQSPALFGLVVIATANISDFAEKTGLTPLPVVRSELCIKGTSNLVSPRKKAITPAEAAGLPFVVYKEEVLDELLTPLFSASPLLDIVSKTSSLTIREDYVRTGQAVTFCDSFTAFIRSRDDDLIYIPITGSPSFTVAFICPSAAALPSAQQQFINDLQNYLAQTYPRYFKEYPT
jgi:DNA-binding transcriptional LysR family regulator